MICIDNGGPAFPQPNVKIFTNDGMGMTGPVEYGMSLRQWYAGQALVGFISNWKGSIWPDPELISKECFAHADSMIAQDSNQPTK